MRVAVVAECFLPECNGVTNSVLRTIEQLEKRGHEAMVIAPGLGPTHYRSAPVERLPAFELPVYRSLSIGVPTGQVRRLLEGYAPDVVHLAAPVVLGAAGARSARALGIPSVAVYQTDLAGFSRRYGCKIAQPAIWRWLRWVHSHADLTLAPSSLASWELRRHGIGPLAEWGRGVDLDRFNPDHRSPMLRRRLAPGGEVIVGYMGRLAPEKQVHLLAHLRGVKGIKVIVVGDGPAAGRLRQQLPGVTFLGFQSGLELSQTVASFDVFVHAGADETFCQAIQEALASGIPVVAPAAGGPMDRVQHGHNGWLFPASDPAVLRGAVEQLAGDREMRRAMGRQARASVEHRSWDVLGAELIAHYRRVIGREDRPRLVA